MDCLGESLQFFEFFSFAKIAEDQMYKSGPIIFYIIYNFFIKTQSIKILIENLVLIILSFKIVVF